MTQSGNQLLATNYLNFEHTDGLNIISIELEKQRPVDLFGARFPSRLFGLAGVGSDRGRRQRRSRRQHRPLRNAAGVSQPVPENIYFIK